ncbi:MAG: ASCH domain-containing protein [Alphaproteobacteria bacterium]|nr:ASCH domain-containing protein [Alphaproteobacteria bacterium]
MEGRDGILEAIMIRALSIIQPWAWLIVHGHKGIENRSWGPPSWMLDKRIIIHASAKKSRDEFAAATQIAEPLGIQLPEIDSLSYGAAIGSAILDGVIESSTNPWFFGPFGWRFNSPIVFTKPIPMRGALGLWKYPGDHPTISA